MKNILKILSVFLFVSLFITSCSDDNDNDTSTLELDFTGLEALGHGFTYEGWIIVDGAPLTTGTFDINENGEPTRSNFEINTEDLEKATTFVLTIEPSPDPDPAPSDVHILGGDIVNGRANLTVGHTTAIGTDFINSTGGYILATPTDGGNTSDETSGVWFLDPTAGPGPSLNLPELPSGWIYEGWAVINGTPVSTGTFRDATGSDNFGGYSGNQAGPPFPGEDFLQNAPNNLSFPTDLSGQTIVISIEPVPDNSSSPFTLKPLVGPVPSNAADHSLLEMNNNAIQTNPTGLVNINI